jgi:cytochrome P450
VVAGDYDALRYTRQVIAEAMRLYPPTWPPFAYFPFGGGRHVCIGQALARHECALVVAAIARTYRLRPAAGRRVVPEPAITLTPKGGLPMTVERLGRHAPVVQDITGAASR